MTDPLFSLKNAFYLGNYNGVINQASDLEGLDGPEAIDKDVYLYRAYIALGSHQVSVQGGGGCSCPAECGPRQAHACMHAHANVRGKRCMHARPSAGHTHTNVRACPCQPTARSHQRVHTRAHACMRSW